MSAGYKRTDYFDNFVYEDQVLKYILTDYGKIMLKTDISYILGEYLPARPKTVVTRTYTRHYDIKDHLGNVRVSFNDSGELLQADSYYPFGMAMDGKSYYNTTQYTDNKNLYLYNGKELQTDFDLDWYDYGARFYDAEIGRWHVSDPMAEKYMSMSPYNYVAGNPIRLIDVDGRWFDDKNEKRASKMEKRAEKRASKLDSKVSKLKSKGKDVGDLKERASELRQTMQDIQDMRNSTTTEFRFAKASDASNKVRDPNGKGLPVTAKTDKDQITMYMNNYKNFHEPRHGGQIARNEYSIPNVWGNPDNNYGASHEISAYRAEYSYNGNLEYFPLIDTSNLTVIMQLVTQGIQSFKQNVSNINQINLSLLQRMYDSQGINQQPIYLNNPKNWWKQ